MYGSTQVTNGIGREASCVSAGSFYTVPLNDDVPPSLTIPDNEARIFRTDIKNARWTNALCHAGLLTAIAGFCYRESTEDANLKAVGLLIMIIGAALSVYMTAGSNTRKNQYRAVIGPFLKLPDREPTQDLENGH